MQLNKAAKLNDKKYKFTTDSGVSVVNLFVCWSFYSKIQKLILDKFHEVIGDKVSIYNINADQDKSLIEKYTVKSFPTILIFKNGVNVAHLQGLQVNDTLCRAVYKYIDKDEFSRN